MQPARKEALKAIGWTDELIEEYEKSKEALRAAGWTDELIEEYLKNLTYDEAFKTYAKIKKFELTYRNCRATNFEGAE